MCNWCCRATRMAVRWCCRAWAPSRRRKFPVLVGHGDARQHDALRQPRRRHRLRARANELSARSGGAHAATQVRHLTSLRGPFRLRRLASALSALICGPFICGIGVHLWPFSALSAFIRGAREAAPDKRPPSVEDHLDSLRIEAMFLHENSRGE